MKKITLILFFSFQFLGLVKAQNHPVAANQPQRTWFQDAKFGLFIHWGPFSIPGSGEWVMENRGINVKNYTNLKDFFNPIDFNAAEYVSMAKNAGMKYITLITRHHDGFSMWDTKFSDFNIMNTPYKKDVVKMMADECHKQGIKLFLYYSLLDWRREDYPHETGKTGKRSGRTGKGDYESYRKFMENQLTELLTNYGEIAGIWFDGHWDQYDDTGANARISKLDWKYDEIYGLIHKLQPHCMVGNNHHVAPFPGEDFQMFERDLPGENKAGMSFGAASDKLPLETCETISDSWGYNLSDVNYKSDKTLIRMLVKAACLNANLLLNIGPMPNGKIQPEFKERLAAMGDWLKNNGKSIYNTRGGTIKPNDNWGMTRDKNKIYIHLFNKNQTTVDFNLEGIGKIKKAYTLNGNKPVNFKTLGKNLQLENVYNDGDIDTVIALETN